ncbi:MAG: M28 family metallopeptidase [Dermatophilaceae bacterium]
MRRLALVVAAAFTATAAIQQPAHAAVDEVNTAKIRTAVTVNGILAHQRAFHRIADANGGTRASGTPGYDASAAYVRQRLQRAGYRVTTQEFTFPFFRELTPSVVEQTAPDAATYTTGAYEYSGSGDVTGTIVPTTDIVSPATPEPSSTSGCEADDFVPAGADPQIALVQRGTCNFADKAANAKAAGYDAVIIFNEGNPGREDLFVGTLSAPFDLPVVGLTSADGFALATAAQEGAVTGRVATSTETRDATTTNVIADTRTGNPNKTIVVGAHLDSVIEGPGINDNGSGSATILEIAEEMAAVKIRPRQAVRFAFWGAEENGLLGSEHYVSQLADDQLEMIYANLNFDMVGSPNYVRFVYDGDGSDTPVTGPPGSGEIERIFTSYFDSQNLASSPTEFSGRSDYGPFIDAGIPAGGLFTGAEGIKTEEEASIYGGTAGEAYDTCYHLACDTLTNVSTKALAEMGDAAAHATATLALSRSGLFEDSSRRAASKARDAASDLAMRGGVAVR